MRALMGAGASLYASGFHVCMGANPAFVPKPTRTNTNASLSTEGSSSLATCMREDQFNGLLDCRDDMEGGKVGENNAEQRKRDADGTDDDIFPCGFNRAFTLVKRNEKCRGKRRRFGPDPQETQIVREATQASS